MSTGVKFTKAVGILVLCVGSLSSAFAGTEHQRKPKKPQAPPLASGPTGPVPQIPLDSITPLAPTVSYQNGQLTIVAANSTLGDILRAVKKQTGAEIEIPAAGDRVVTHLGPGPARDVMAELLNGSRFNYVILGSPEDANVLTHIVLVPKSPDVPNVNNAIAQQPQQQAMIQAGMMPGNMAPPPPEMAQDAPDADAAADENADDANGDPAAVEAEQQQQQAPQDPNGVKTPQQMLQEMQQRQMQLQQNQPPGQPPIPGTGLPQRPPQEP